VPPRSMVRNSRPAEPEPLSEGRARPEARTSVWVLATAALLGAAAILVLRDHLAGQPPAGAAALPGPSDEPAPPPPVSAPAAAAAPAPSSETGHIRVRIAASPPGARITIDGISVASNPFEGTFVKDVAMHRILVDAYGFLPHGRMVSFEKDVELTIALHAKPTGGGASAAATPPGTTLPVSPELKPR
jgi:hypothetical protein